MTTPTNSQLRRAKNEAVFKNRNERVLQVSSQLLDSAAKRELPLNFVCECADKNCTDQLNLTVHEFTELRRGSKHFIVRPGHEQLDIERIVKRAATYYLIEKLVPVPASPDIVLA